MEKLNLIPIRKESLMLSTFGPAESNLNMLDVMQLKIKARNDTGFVFVETLVIPTICASITNQQPKVVKSQFRHLENLYLSDYSDSQNVPIDMLIGADYYFSFMTGRCIKGVVPNSPVALESCIGWVLIGPTNRKSENFNQYHTALSVANEMTTSDNLHDNFRRFWEIESVNEHSGENVMDTFLQDIKFDGTRYITKLPFKSFCDFLPDNYELSKKRLLSLNNRLLKDRDLRRGYREIFEDYEREGIIEPVPPTDIGEPGKTHYIPHRPVVRQDRETTKIRIVFDASAKIGGGASLNDCLYSGPNMLSKVFDILLRFRTKKIGILSDIKKAFLNVGIHHSHKDYLRFLWFDPETNCIKIFRFLRVLFGATSSPFLLQGTIRYHFNYMVQQGLIDAGFADEFLKNLYVDDSSTVVDSVNDGLSWYEKAKRVMNTGGFTLRKWRTNNKELQAFFDDKERLEGEPIQLQKSEDDCNFADFQLGINSENMQTVLGINWDLEKDNFIFDFKNIIALCEKMVMTKRNVLRISSSFYDPLGLISPITVLSKCVFQILCKEKLDWDCVIPDDIMKKWTRFISCLKLFDPIQVPRFVIYPVEKTISIQLHGFCDSSLSSYCACIYLRRETVTGIYIDLLTAKTKVAPLTTITIPRLELSSCQLLADHMNYVTCTLNNIEFSSIYCWTDSEIALCWITGVKKQWNIWVENRVVKIRKKSNNYNWRHVPGSINPADIATRNITVKDLDPESIWFTGPKFLLSPSSDWPNKDVDDNIVHELKRSTVSLVAKIKKSEDYGGISIQNFSDINRLLRVTAYILRFKHNIIASIRNQDKRTGDLNVSDIKEAEKFLIIKNQQFIVESDKFTLITKSLNVITDVNGLLRIKGRLEHAVGNFETKCPLLLRDDHLSHLFILRCHVDIMHGGVEATLSRLRCRFWLIRGRQVVKRVLHRCVTCRRHQGRPLVPPTPPALPIYRVTADFCFQNTGCDFAGPLLVKPIYNVEQKVYKAFICLFTCATSRAIHLELTPDLTGLTFIRALRRFIARRGFPSLIITDNAQTFTSNVVKSFLLKNNIEKKSILPSSPWWGGFYERLVRSVKLPLRKVLGKARLSYDEMETSLIEVESIINSRPLTYLYSDDITEPLTPSHLMFGRNIHVRRTSPDEICEINLGNRAQYIQRTISLFWKQFYNSYLAELREHHMYVNKRSKFNDVSNLLKVDDVVILKEDKPIPRTSWRIAKVESLVLGNDQRLRGAVLSTISPEGRKTKLSRPIQKIIPLEVMDRDDSSVAKKNIEAPLKIENNEVIETENFKKVLNYSYDDSLTADEEIDDSRVATYIDDKYPCQIVANDDVVKQGTENSEKALDCTENRNKSCRPRRAAAEKGELIRRILNSKYMFLGGIWGGGGCKILKYVN